MPCDKGAGSWQLNLGVGGGGGGELGGGGGGDLGGGGGGRLGGGGGGEGQACTNTLEYGSRNLASSALSREAAPGASPRLTWAVSLQADWLCFTCSLQAQQQASLRTP